MGEDCNWVLNTAYITNYEVESELLHSILALNTLYKTTVDAGLTQLQAGLTSAYQEFTPDEKRILFLKTDWLMFEMSDSTIQVPILFFSETTLRLS